MKRRIIYIIALILLCCGCSTEYTIEIDENLGVKEYARAVETEDFFEQYPNSSIERVVGFLLEPNLEYLNSNGFTVSDVNESEEAGVIISNSYESIEEYIKTSKIYEQYGNLEYSDDNGKITLRIKGLLSNNEQDQSGKYLIDTSKINIKLPHNVIGHNADSVDEETGVYTWNINEPGVERELYITFDKTIKSELPIGFILVGIIAVALIILGYLTYSKVSSSRSKRNEI